MGNVLQKFNETKMKFRAITDKTSETSCIMCLQRCRGYFVNHPANKNTTQCNTSQSITSCAYAVLLSDKVTQEKERSYCEF